MRPGEIKNPEGHNQYTKSAARANAERTADAFLEAPVQPAELEALVKAAKLPRALAAMIPADMTRLEFLIVVHHWDAIMGSPEDRKAALARLLPPLQRHELSGELTLAELVRGAVPELELDAEELQRGATSDQTVVTPVSLEATVSSAAPAAAAEGEP